MTGPVTTASRIRLLAFVAPLVTLPLGWVPAYLIATGVRTDCHDANGAPIAAGDPGCPAPLAYQITHPTASWGFNHVFGPLLLVALVVVPVVVVAITELKLLRRSHH
ncbi:MAG TPA: hypothetical protein VNA65_00620 [Candidatus Dormibacteraeota bacterium]|nr:hypothetical protein [Candidatus Dormibacteraeota bacterium]